MTVSMHEYAPPVRSALVAGAAVLTLYVLTLAPTTAFWDASEYIATAHILGIPHPPGNSLFVILARVWTLLLAPFGMPVAVRVNLFAAVTSAGAATCWFLVAHRIASAVLVERRMAMLAAAAATLTSATAFTVWHQSTVNEKVYTVSMLVIGLVSWLAFRWWDRRDEPGSERYLLISLYLIVLGSTNHLMSVLPLPALGLFVLIHRPALLLRGDLWARVVPLVLLGLSFNLFLPIRSAEDPPINEGQPTCEVATEAVIAVFTNGRAGCRALAANLQREQYGKPPVTQRNATFAAQVTNYFQYFDWQWARGIARSDQPGGARLPFTLLFLALGVVGLWTAWRADRATFLYLAALTGTVTIGLIFYLNFRYGFSLNPEVTDPNLHEVRERDYFFIVSFSLWGMLAGVGMAGVVRPVTEWVGDSAGKWAATPVFALALIPLVSNYAWASRADDYAARDWAYDLLVSVEPYGIIFTNGDNDTFPLWYLQEVEGIRQDVTVVVVQYLFTSWYPQQLQRLSSPDRQRPFDPAVAGGLYQDRAPPTDPIIALSYEDMDRVQGGRLSQDQTVQIGELGIVYPAGTELSRGQLLALTMIRDSVDERPVYFASSAGIMSALGLQEWGVRHGLAVKLDPRPEPQEPDPNVVELPASLGGGRIDVDRSRTLTSDVYSYRGLENRNIWADRATVNIPLQYYILFAQLTAAASQVGLDQETIDHLTERTQAFLQTYQSGNHSPA